MGFTYISSVPLLPSCSGFFVFGCRISFLVGSRHFFTDGCSAVRCDFGIFMGGGELKVFYAAIYPNNMYFLFHIY